MSEEHKTLAEALIAAQRDMPAVGRDGTNPHFGSKFTTLDGLLSKVRPVLNKHGFAVMQMPTLDGDGRFVLRTKLIHAQGDVEFDSPLTPTKNDPQGQGSAITYMRRYALASALAIADQEDDDGNAGSAPDDRSFEQLLKDAGASAAAIGAITEYATSLTPAQLAKATEGLKANGKAAEYLGRLETAASEFAEKSAA